MAKFDNNACQAQARASGVHTTRPTPGVSSTGNARMFEVLYIATLCSTLVRGKTG